MKIKTTLFLLLMLLASVNNYSQQIFTDESRIIKVESKFENSKLSLSTKFLLIQAKQNVNNTPTEVNINSLVRITLLFENDCTNFNNENIFSNITKLTENISTAFVKVVDLPLLENIKCLKYADIGEKLEREDYNSLVATNANILQSGVGLNQAYTGAGVIVGIIDDGFDYTHPNFKDSNGNIRISRLWERTNNSGNPPTNLGFTYGSEYIGSTAILNKQYDIINQSHGTHVTGIAAGSGTGNISQLKGMAPNSEIVLVSGYNTVIPTDNNYIDAVNYLKNYATSVNKPIVINMSFGTGLGPHDGTTVQEEAINSLSNTPGLVLVAAAGNDGGQKTHALNVFNGNQTKFILNSKNIYSGNENSTIDIWGNNQGVNSAFGVTIGVYNTSNQSYDSSVIQFIVNGNLNFQNPYTLVDVDFGPLNDDNWTISFFSEINPRNNRPHLRITCNTLNDTSSDFLVVAIQSIDDIIHSWCANCEFNNPSGLNFTDGDDLFSIYSPGNANGVITVGSYNVTGENLGSPAGTVGGLSYFSCKGPRTDFLIKPDITAPGNRIVSSLSSFDSRYLTIPSLNNDITNTFGAHFYGKQQGTSMAAPVVSGIVALWLQRYPQLTTNGVRTIISNTSITTSPVSDSFLFYGTTYSTPPNVKWGYGKIDALAGMQFLIQLDVDTFNPENNFVVYPNPTSSKIIAKSNEFYDRLEVYNVLGQKTYTQAIGAILDNLEIDISSLPKGTYIFKFSNADKTKSIKVVKQ